MNHAVVQSLWIGPRLGTMERICLTSFRSHGHRVRLFTYGPVENVPEGVELAPAEEILPWTAAFRTHDGSYANFSDLFRYHLLVNHGGWWVDCDVLCLRPWLVERETVICSTDEAKYGRTANVFVLRAPPGDRVMAQCVEECALLGDRRFIFAHTGPYLMDRVIKLIGGTHLLAPPEMFAPVPWNSAGYLVVSRPFIRHIFHLKNLLRRRHLVPRFTPRTVGIHLWSGMWRMSGMDRDGVHPRSSLYASFRRKYSI